MSDLQLRRPVTDTPNVMCDSVNVPGTNNATIPVAVELGHRLRSLDWTISTAESCTGGGIALAITSVAGSSDYFSGSVVAYSNDIKQRILGVSRQTLSAHGAVSDDCAREMAVGIRNTMGTTIGISSTGIAGPGGATSRKPVGLVYIAAATAEAIVSQELHLSGDRASIMREAAERALALAMDVVGAEAPSNGDEPR